MTLKEFAECVADMRHAQKDYFRTRSKSALDNSIRMEKEVDKKLQEIHNQQLTLFDNQS
jgi:hypothetical protein